MPRVIISGIGVHIPEASISNDELVASFNAWVAQENPGRAAAGLPPLEQSTSSFIVHASGIVSRRVYAADGILDPDRMTPRIPARPDDALSVQAEFGAASARAALADAGVDAGEVDLVICATAHLQRMYPAVAVEIQREIGAVGAAFDMLLGCSSALAALHIATGLVRAGAHRRVLIVTPELITPNTNFRDRQTHFLFGDASVSLVVEAIGDDEVRPGRLEVVRTAGQTQFSNNIRSNIGYMMRAEQGNPSVLDMEGALLRQVGSRVFKDVTTAVHRFVLDFLALDELTPQDLRRYWLHQANARMNAMILKLTLGGEADQDRAPIVLDRLGNTSAAGAIVALKEHHADMKPGDTGLLCAFGAGYSIGAALLRMQ